MKMCFVLAAGVTLGLMTAPAAQVVTESARDIPLAYDVDVVVIGGSTRAVAAAEAAAKAGAKVFLAAPRPYLGEDMCGTYRLWLEPGEQPQSALAQAIFSAPQAADTSVNPGLDFTYTTSIKADKMHPDGRFSRLKDGKRSSASQDSAQYNGDVSIVTDLGKTTSVKDVVVMAYQRTDDFAVKDVTLFASNDKTSWKKIASQANPTDPAAGIENRALEIKLPVRQSARYLRFDIAKTDTATRVLLAELVINGEEPPVARTAPTTPPVQITTPMQVKVTLDDTLLAAKVDFLYGSYVTDILLEEGGEIGGIIMANRSGRQAVKARVIIDATDRAVAARLAGASFSKYPGGTQPFSRIVVGGQPGDEAKDLGITYNIGKTPYKVYEYQLDLPMRDATWRSFAKADQVARNKTWQTGQAAAAENLLQIPPDALLSRKADSRAWKDAAQVELDALRPKGIDHLYVLSGSAELSREAAAQVMRPLQGMALGARVGAAAVVDASGRKPIHAVLVRDDNEGDHRIVKGAIGEMLHGLRSKPLLKGATHVKSPERLIPVIARYDTIVVGGGTGGGPAGVGAARGGAKTLVVEYLHGLGGVGTLGRISKYYHGNRVGFTAEVDKGVVTMAGGGKVDARSGWNIENKMEWLRSEVVKAGGDVWFQTLGIGAVVRDQAFIGVVLATPHGRGVILANTVIDATGNAVIPACANLDTQEITGEHISVQGTGLPPFTPGESYYNTDWTFADDDDVLDMWRIHVVGKKKYKGAFDMGQLIDTRARRRIVGDLTVSPMDIINQRVYPDVITVSKSNFDNHGFSSHDLFMITPPDKSGLTGNVPYRALLPKDHDNILVTGLGMSAHGDAMPVMRMQADVQNQGYAAGKASAMAAEEATTVRNIDVTELQKHLVKKGVIPESMVGAEDTYPIGPEKMQNAVKRIGKDYSGIAQVLTNPDMARPMLQRAWKAAPDESEKLRYAHVLGMLLDDTGYETLIKAVDAATWDKGWNFRGMGQFGATTSPLDNLVIALGRTGRQEALPVMLRKLEQLTPQSEFSHCRAVAMALEVLRDPAAAKPLADFLKQPDIGGHSFLEINNVIQRSPANKVDTTTRNNSLRELIVARALYRCGDHEGLGERILNEYAEDFRGHYSRHAKAVLSEGN